MSAKNPIRKILNELKKQNWTSHFIELLIVILGIFIAFQFAKMGERKNEKQQYLELVAGVKLENEKNREEFEELRTYRKETLEFSNNLLRLLNDPASAPKDSIRYYLFRLYRISTPDLQFQAIEGLINSTFSFSNLDLKNEAIRLKALYDEWLLSSDEFTTTKQEKFFVYLYQTIDFHRGKILDYSDLFSLAFKNNVWEICGSEEEQSRLYNVAFEQFEKFDRMVVAELED